MNNQIINWSTKESDKDLIQKKILLTFKKLSINMPLKQIEGSKFLIGTKIVDFKFVNN